MMNVAIVILCLVPYFAHMTTAALTDTHFDNDVLMHEHESGGQLRLESKGKLTEIIDLDNIPAVKRVLCKGSKVLVALHAGTDDVTVMWAPGQLLLGSDQWNCYNNALRAESKTIYALVERVRRPRDGIVEVYTTAAGPLDMFDEADIRVHYDQGPAAPSRRRRYLSNPLQASLTDINWDAAFTSSIPFNMAGSDEQATDAREINVYKSNDSHVPDMDTTTNQTGMGKDFLFRCISCHGHTDISYYFELKVKKVENKAVVLKYTVQLELDTTIHQSYSLDADGEISVTKSGTPWTGPPEMVFQAPVAVFKTFPPIVMSVTYASQANMALTSTCGNVTHYSGDMDINGKLVISQAFEVGRSVVNEVSSYNWTSVTSGQDVDTNSTLNASFAFHQNLTIYPAISWSQKDIDMDLGPPIRVSVRPTVRVLSTSDGTERCFSSSVAVDANVTVTETDFSVEAYRIPIWNERLMDRLSRRLEPHQQALLSHCRADCHGDVFAGDDLPMEDVCGAPSALIVRGDSRFKTLKQIWGDYILFRSEDDSGINSWCGDPGRNCLDCTRGIVGEDDDQACAVRMMTTDLASSTTRLAKFVRAEWHGLKLLVTEAWDQPTYAYPDGKHGNVSVFNDGRAVSVTVTLTTGELDQEMELTNRRRLAELAVCSRFPYVASHPNNRSISMCVKPNGHDVEKRSVLSRKRRSGDVDHSLVSSILESVGEATAREQQENVALSPVLALHGTSPPGETMESACGDYTGAVSQDVIARFKRLVPYPFDDVVFDPEGLEDTWCGVETRRCRNCSTVTGTPDVWDWCATRTMGMRLATRLQRLAVLSPNVVKVEKALTSRLEDGMSMLYLEGRALRIQIPPGDSNFISIAIQAGFDYVAYTDSAYIEVCAKLQDGLESQIVFFPNVNLLGVPLPYGMEGEYDYPVELRHESRKPLLFDKTTSPDAISEHFNLNHFLSPGKRYIRLDPVLITLLELAQAEFTDGFYVIQGSAYRPRSVNRDNIEGRQPQERYRYQTGQAVEVKPAGRVNQATLLSLGMALMKVAKTVKSSRIGVGIGSKVDRLYFHVRPVTADAQGEGIDVWDSGNTELYMHFKHVQEEVAKGGTIIPARPDGVVCRTPVLGKEHFYYNFDLDDDGYCSAANGDFCPQSRAHRYNASRELQDRLTSAAGSGMLPRPDILPEIEGCLLHTCGGCPGTGVVWREKVVQCTRMINKYLSRASTPFQPLNDKVTIFNTENTESTVHSQACHDGKICVENTQIYSLLLPALTATYRAAEEEPDELQFGGADNPSPLLEIVEQELAWRAVGRVEVYLESEKDVTALRNVLKIIMMFNKNVTEVDFHIDPDTDRNDVITTVHRKLGQWSGSVCPTWSRLVMPPYKFHTIPHERKRRSLERSEGRNKEKLAMQNWEIDWILKS